MVHLSIRALEELENKLSNEASELCTDSTQYAKLVDRYKGLLTDVRSWVDIYKTGASKLSKTDLSNYLVIKAREYLESDIALENLVITLSEVFGTGNVMDYIIEKPDNALLELKSVIVQLNNLPVQKIEEQADSLRELIARRHFPKISH